MPALAVAGALVGWSFVAPRVRGHPLPNAALGTGLYAICRPPLGIRPPALKSGVRSGLAAGALTAAAVAASTAIPRVRREMAARQLPAHTLRWLLLDIPLGTVWPEEAAYRATLGKMADEAFGPRAGRLVQAVAFGLSHTVDARDARDSVPGTVVLTGLAGWAFGWLYARSGSLVAPMLAHLAANEAAAAAAIAVSHRSRSASAQPGTLSAPRCVPK